MTVTCKSFRVRHETENVILEIDEAQPANLVPQLLSKVDVANRLAVSARKVETIAASGRLPIVRVDGCVRFREEDVLRLLEESQERNRKTILQVVPTKRLAV